MKHLLSPQIRVFVRALPLRYVTAIQSVHGVAYVSLDDAGGAPLRVGIESGNAADIAAAVTAIRAALSPTDLVGEGVVAWTFERERALAFDVIERSFMWGSSFSAEWTRKRDEAKSQNADELQVELREAVAGMSGHTSSPTDVLHAMESMIRRKMADECEGRDEEIAISRAWPVLEERLKELGN